MRNTTPRPQRLQSEGNEYGFLSVYVTEPLTQVLMAVMHLVSLLTPRTRKLLLRSIPEHHATTATPTTTIPPALPRATATRYTNMMSQRRVRTWKGLSCFTGRVLARTGYLQRPAKDIVTACNTLVRWWEAEGRPKQLHLRPANAFTAHLQLLYTSLGVNDPIYNTACRQLGLTEVTAVPPSGGSIPESSSHPRDTDTDAIPLTEVWRSFTRRFPMLGCPIRDQAGRRSGFGCLPTRVES